MKFWIASFNLDSEKFEKWYNNILKWLSPKKCKIVKIENSFNKIYSFEIFSSNILKEEIKIESKKKYIIEGNSDIIKDIEVNFSDLLNANGDFSGAFIIKDSIVIHNNKYSTKNVYYYNKDGFYASNDIRLLMCSPDVPFVISKKQCQLYCTSISQIMDQSLIPKNTFFENVYQLIPNSTLFYKKGTMEIFKNKWAPSKKFNFSRNYSGFRALLNSILIKKINKSEKIGIELSGGLDSALVLASLIDSGFDPKKIYAFCMSFKDESMIYSNDEQIARKLIKHFGINGYIVYGDKSLSFWNLKNVRLNNFDGPIMSANLYVGETFDALCSKLGINILLTGDGGDYILSGNPYIFDSIYRRNKSNAKKMINELFSKKRFKIKWNLLYKPLLGIGYYNKIWKESDLITPYYFTKKMKIIEKNERKKYINSLKISKSYKSWFKRYMFDFLMPRGSYLKDINTNTEYFHPIYDNRIIDYMFEMDETLIYDISKKNEYLSSKQVIRNSYNDILPEFIREKSIKTSYGSMNRIKFKNDKKKLLEMFDPKNPLEIDEYDIINREQFYKLLLSVINMTDDKSMQYSVNIRFVEGIINLQIWLSLVAKGRNYVLKKSKITSTKIYGDIEKVGDFIENN